ncbi:MAG: redox-sensing transcriptional repressor Rex [Peptostreptococcus sp.]|mgnify:FL=1|jgi:redox-sensing transcriptional repressor|uniref:redox-sensing transcriptional repressor Rex n=1 Tax=Peptostreptococcus TaxID=1257 RepID=UPI000766F564|nr:MULTISPECIES: redox-sensing transcriptional repressor Rex [Peptostreptococcus]KXB68702.1 putative redox-sensing transcriptional repressor Rex [Peptostreptococcus anaerobius]MBS5595766.1 redox-sensing transcriptional repressor Rex [Peptostreptococcus sp.]MDB8821052.1 redox-sensing transcriptional repressor Rex [Peptostreptococcus anaerobius]MDB8825530.1 redox-sensing transcriptional repressor Rex [Peptostreptococcus anaerobius]MDB8827544.1 redox-sensing transcriptional repressor Rex [Peptost
MGNKNISMAVIRRLPKYYRYLADLLSRDIQRISSKELSEIIGFTASQIRQDLNNFGGFGQQGYGYNVEALHREIGKILGLDRKYRAVLVGAGNLGQALTNYSGFKNAGFNIEAVFDANPKMIGLKIRDYEIMDSDNIESFVSNNDIDIAILCIPKNGAQAVANKLVSSGVRGIWNFAPIDLEVPSEVIVENVNLTESLFTLSYLMKESDDQL